MPLKTEQNILFRLGASFLEGRDCLSFLEGTLLRKILISTGVEHLKGNQGNEHGSNCLHCLREVSGLFCIIHLLVTDALKSIKFPFSLASGRVWCIIYTFTFCTWIVANKHGTFEATAINFVLMSATILAKWLWLIDEVLYNCSWYMYHIECDH